MNYTKYDLGHKQGGQIVEVTLSGNAANIKLMDSGNFQNYKNGRQHRYFGGLAKQSPVRLKIPNSGHWFITVDLGGFKGSVRTAVRTLPGYLPELKQTPLASVPSLINKYESIPNGISNLHEKDYDVFISHASEDKEEIVRSLALALKAEGLRVWFDEFELKIGDSLRRKIDMGLSKSKFGIVVLSRNFIKKGWTNYELDGIITKAISGEQIILPIWHKITKNEVTEFSPSLADKVARNTSSSTIEEIALEISELIKNA